VLRVGWRIRLYSAAYNLGVELRTRLYARLSNQGPAFYQRQRTGDLMALATNDIDAIEMAAGEAMLAGFDGTLTLVMVLGIMTLGVDPRLAGIALLPFPLMAFAFWRISRQVHTAEADALRRFSALNDHVQESLSGVRRMRALGLEARSAAQFSELAGKAADASLSAQRWEAAYEPAVGAAGQIKPYLKVDLLPNRPAWEGIASGRLDQGILQLTLVWPPGAGLLQPGIYVGQIIANFPKGLRLSAQDVSVKVTAETWAAAPITEPDRAMHPITISWTA